MLECLEMEERKCVQWRGGALEVELETIRSRVRVMELAWGVSMDQLGVLGLNTSFGVLDNE